MPFYLLILVRAAIGEYISFLIEVAIALPVLYLLSRALKGSNMHIARALVLVVFTSLYYKALPFTIFSSLVWCGMIYALYRLNKPAGEILKGITAGAAGALISYALTLLFISLK